MGFILFVLLLGVPLAELYVIVQVSQGIGFVETVLLLIGVSIAGAYLLKQQGLGTLARLQETLARGEMPHRELVDGALILFGGALLLTPGFITDAVGLVLLVPPTRALFKGATRSLFARWAKQRVAPGMRIYNATVTGVERRDATRSRSTTPREESSPQLPHDGDDFPDRE